ncbi:helix-turn-helix domain-containing protein [Pseudomonas asiatica]|uniref:helix-turn-helix domain-containing protein n=1 Tax=Pseudomonas asiatica TaxID=2219225 RepID=UPI0037C88AEC
MHSGACFQRFSYSGLDPSLACDVVYGGHFEHRLLSARHSSMRHQRFALQNMVLETGSYDFPVVACGVMPKEMLCIGIVAEGAEMTRYNTTSIHADEVQIYAPGAELLYHASGSSRWISFLVPETLLQSAAIAQTGRPLLLPKRGTMATRLSVGGRARLVQLVDDAFALGRALQPSGISDVLADSIFCGLIDNYVAALSVSTLADKKRISTAQKHLSLILACERLALTEDMSSLELEIIAKRSGYSRRALELIFNSATGMPPGRWFMNIRLNGVMRDLLTAPEGCLVSDIAARWGFRHFSRFAHQYRRVFGELPSETMRRANSR